MNCDFVITDGVAKCRRPGCGIQAPASNGVIVSVCRGQGGNSPPTAPKTWWFGKVISYVKAQASHLASGVSVPAAEISQRHATCKPCDKYQDGRCVLCSCLCNADPNQWLNKLAIATPEWPILQDAAGKVLFECPQIAREKLLAGAGELK